MGDHGPERVAGVELVGRLGLASGLRLYLASDHSPLTRWFPPRIAGVPGEVFRWSLLDGPQATHQSSPVSDVSGLGDEPDSLYLARIARETSEDVAHDTYGNAKPRAAANSTLPVTTPIEREGD